MARPNAARSSSLPTFISNLRLHATCAFCGNSALHNTWLSCHFHSKHQWRVLPQLDISMPIVPVSEEREYPLNPRTLLMKLKTRTSIWSVRHRGFSHLLSGTKEPPWLHLLPLPTSSPHLFPASTSHRILIKHALMQHRRRSHLLCNCFTARVADV